MLVLWAVWLTDWLSGSRSRLASPGTLHDLLHCWWSRARSWTGRAISDASHWAVPNECATDDEADGPILDPPDRHQIYCASDAAAMSRSGNGSMPG